MAESRVTVSLLVALPISYALPDPAEEYEYIPVDDLFGLLGIDAVS